MYFFILKMEYQPIVGNSTSYVFLVTIIARKSTIQWILKCVQKFFTHYIRAHERTCVSLNQFATLSLMKLVMSFVKISTFDEVGWEERSNTYVVGAENFLSIVFCCFLDHSVNAKLLSKPQKSGNNPLNCNSYRASSSKSCRV